MCTFLGSGNIPADRAKKSNTFEAIALSNSEADGGDRRPLHLQLHALHFQKNLLL
jgi:hypothetical protein